MKKTAFFSFDWNYSIVSEFYRGAQRCVSEHEDVQLTIFNAFGRYNNFSPEEGAFEIFSLCSREEYDGFLIQGNRAWPPGMRQKLVDELAGMGKPVISLNYELNHAGYAGTDNYAAEYGLVSKVLRDQKCIRPAFVNGLQSSAEAGMRKQAFLDACREAGFENPLCLQASWEMEEGIRAAEKLLEDREHLPDIIFCCNDDLAVGVQETLQKNGIRIPEDVRITGFDNREISLRAVPRITTVDRDYEMIGYTAMSALIRRMDGEDIPDRIWSPVQYILSDSCGYGTEPDSGDRMNAAYYSMNSALKQFYEMLSGFQPAVLSAETLSDILHECEQYFPQMGCRNVYLVMNDEYLDYEVTRRNTGYGLKGALAAHWGDSVPAEYDYRHIYERFEIRDLLPPCAPEGRQVYMVFPLRQNTTCIGYVLTDGVSPVQQYGFLSIILTLVSSAIESVRKKEILQKINSRLDDLYVHDQLTGLFNRFGLDRFGRIAYEHLLRDFEEAQFIFVDVDGMKTINDVYGHDAGDQALRDTADIIVRATSDENAFAMRWGGDEFLLICRRNLIPKLEQELMILRRGTSREFDLSLSMGAFRVRAEDRLSVNEAIDRADEKMYEMKNARKAELRTGSSGTETA